MDPQACSRKVNTISEYMDVLKRGGDELKQRVVNNISLSAGVDLFQQFVSRSIADLGVCGAMQMPRNADSDTQDFEHCRRHLIKNGRLFVQRAKDGRRRIADLGEKFVRDDSIIMTHGYSRSIVALLLLAAQRNKRIQVIVTEGRPSGSGALMLEMLEQHGIPCQLVTDSAVGHLMERVDQVIVGAEGVVENGGLINQIGTYQIALVAKANRIPFYALSECHKFVRMFPLRQSSLPVSAKSTILASRHAPARPDPASSPVVVGRHVSSTVAHTSTMTDEQLEANPTLDYTPPELISALITDIGILDPMSGASEELIHLYNL